MLKSLANTVVHCKTQEEYDELMDIYEKAGWEWCNGTNPKHGNDWPICKDKTCIKVENWFSFADYPCYESMGYKIISLKEFKEIQGLGDSQEDTPTNPYTMVYDFANITSTIGYIYNGATPEYFRVLSTVFTCIQDEWNNIKKNKNMIIKNAFKSKESKAVEHFCLGSNSNDLNHDGLLEFVQYLYENDNVNRKGFLNKLVEAHKETKNK